MTWRHSQLSSVGASFGQRRGWSHDTTLDWGALQYPEHGGVLGWVRDLNHRYRREPALYEIDFQREGFEWMDCHDAENSVISFVRRARSILMRALSYTSGLRLVFETNDAARRLGRIPAT